MKPVDAIRLRHEAAKVFSPSAPIDEHALFAGRNHQVRQVIDAINQRGQHAIIFGERGVGKTSLANVLTPWLESLGERVVAPRINCDGLDTFETAWRKMFSEISVAGKTRRPGFVQSTAGNSTNLSTQLPETIAPDDIRKLLASLGSPVLLILVFDEFDRLGTAEARRLFADTIKALSDHSVRVTVILVGVADTVEQLVEEHHSVGRALVQIRMPRMSPQELREIVEKGLARLQMQIDDDALGQISLLSQGLPHYTHLLGLHASREAIDDSEIRIKMRHVESAISKAVDEAQQTIRSAYHKATSSPRKESLYAEVLLACAFAKRNDLGYFAAADVREPMGYIMGKPYDIPSFARHLTEFCEPTRGCVLQRIGTARRFRFRFHDPLMQPFVLMRGFAAKKIPAGMLKASA